MRTQKYFLTGGLLFLLGLGLAACSGGEAEENASPAERTWNVRVLPLRATDLEESIVISGPMRPVAATDIATQESGVIRTISADKGSVVRKGQTVVLLDRRLLESEMKSAEAARVLREYNEERTRRLFDANSVSKQEMLRVYTELQQARAAEEIAKLRYERAAIKSPFNGMVADRYVEEGALVAPGTRVARIVDPYTVKLVGSVSEQQIAAVEEGAAASVTLNNSRVVLNGVVRYVAIEANPVNGKFTVEVEVKNPDLVMRGGVVGRARIRKAVHNSVMAIPRDALVTTELGPQVYVVEEDRAVARSVTLGASQGLMVEVVSGLKVGDRLVVRGQRQLQAGGKVIVQETATARDGSLPTDPPEVREEGSIPEVPAELAEDAEALK